MPSICFGSLSSWKIHPRGIPCLTNGTKTSFRMSLKTNRSIMPWIRWNGPVFAARKSPQTISDPPSCLTVGIWYFTLYFSPTGHRTYLMPSLPKRLNLLSSEKKTFPHYSCVHPICSFAHASLCLLFLGEIHDFFAGRRPLSPALISRLCTVLLDTRLPWLVVILAWISTEFSRGSALDNRMIRLSSRFMVFLGRPVRWAFTTPPRTRWRATIDWIADVDRVNCLASWTLVWPLLRPIIIAFWISTPTFRERIILVNVRSE